MVVIRFRVDSEEFCVMKLVDGSGLTGGETAMFISLDARRKRVSLEGPCCLDKHVCGGNLEGKAGASPCMIPVLCGVQPGE